MVKVESSGMTTVSFGTCGGVFNEQIMILITPVSFDNGQLASVFV